MNAPLSSSAILCRDLRKRYPARPEPVDAVNGLNLEVRRGECFGLLGPNGAGKTTTIEILEGLLAATSGEVFVLGRRWGEDDQALRQKLGISLQETRLAEKLTVRETVILFRSFYDHGLDPDAVLTSVSLTEKAKALVGKLSGGQKQRLALACALTTHYMDEAERLCDRVAIVDHGKVIALGTPQELIAQLGGEHLIEFVLEGTTVLPDEMLARLPCVVSVRRDQDAYCLSVTAIHHALPALLEKMHELNHGFTRLITRHVSLEDVFVTMTGRHLREEE